MPVTSVLHHSCKQCCVLRLLGLRFDYWGYACGNAYALSFSPLP
jgi:hypothetical protein